MPLLPDAPHELVLLAISDLEKVSGDDRYVVCMGRWHSPVSDVEHLKDNSENTQCAVCFAGSVMAKTLNVDIDRDVKSLSKVFKKDTDTVNKLMALDFIRMGDVRKALDQITSLSKEFSFGIPFHVDVPKYSEDREGFISSMRYISNILEERHDEIKE